MNHAHVTAEATLEHLGHTRHTHPLFQTESVEACFRIRLSPEERTLAEEILSQRTGTIRGHIRSALAQLGLEGFGDDYTEYKLTGSRLLIRTLLTDLRVPCNSPTLKAIRDLFHGRKTGSFHLAHAGLFPHAAHRGDVSFPIQNAYVLDKQFGVPEIETMLSAKSARKWIESHRIEIPDLPGVIGAGRFGVYGIDASAHDDHTVLLDPNVQTNGAEQDMHHLHSHILQKKRSTMGPRQVELMNKGSEVPLSAVRVTGRLYDCVNGDSGV